MWPQMPLFGFAFAQWESVRVEEIKTQPETDVRTGTISCFNPSAQSISSIVPRSPAEGDRRYVL